MKISWLGHACFLIAGEKVCLVTDPFDEETGYKPLSVHADIVTVSHPHHDHNAVELVLGDPQVIRTPGIHHLDSIDIKGIEVYHDKQQGKSRGKNVAFVINIDGLTVCHLGDLGHILDKEQIAAIGPVNILLVPVGGNYTINATEAMETIKKINPQITIPMHYKTPDCNVAVAPVEDFIKNYDSVVKIPFLEVSSNTINNIEPIVLLDYQ
ncbi:MAG: MBL fold metallo-hydrolase [Chitinophagales bacterium]